MYELLATTPLWLWLLVAALAGALTLYLYHSCFIGDARRQFAAWDEERRLELEEHRSQLRMMQGALAERDAALAAAEVGGEDASADALRAAKYRAWVYETRLRRALSAAEAGEPIDVRALSADLDEFADGETPADFEAQPFAFAAGGEDPSTAAARDEALRAEEALRSEERSRFKYQVWSLRQRLEQAERAAAENAGPGDAATPEPVELALAGATLGDPEGARDERMAARLQRALSAAKRGDLRDLAAIEAEAIADAPEAGEAAQGTAAALAEAPESPAPDLAGDLEAMRYRTWLLASRLRRTAAEAASGAPIDMAAIRLDLDRAAAAPGARAAEAAPTATPEETPQEAAVAADDAAAARLSEENQVLRYRGWRLARRLSDAAELIRAGGRIDPDKLTAEIEPVEDGEREAADALIDRAAEAEARAAAEAQAHAGAVALADRIRVVEGALRAQRSHAAEAGRRATEARREASSLKYRLWLAHSELRGLRDATADARHSAQTASAERTRFAAEAGTSQDARRAAFEDASSLRERLSAAEAALRGLRAAPTADPASEAALAAAQDEIAALRAQLWSKAWEADAPRSEDEGEGEGEDQTEALAAAEQEIARLSTRLEETEAALRQEADRAAREEALEAELTTLRAAAAAATAVAAAPATGETTALLSRAKKAETERDVLRTRFGLAQAELERLSTSGARPRAAAWTASAEGSDFRPAKASTPPKPAAPSPAVNPLTLAYGPMLGVEAAAQELLERPELDEARPSDLGRFPVDQAPDDLTLIEGVDADVASALARLEIRGFRQIAEISPVGLAWLDRRLKLDGRTIRDRWAPQAQRWRDRKADGELSVSNAGIWTLATLSDAEAAPAEDAPEEAAPSQSAPSVEPENAASVETEQPPALASAPTALRTRIQAERADQTPPPPDRAAIDAPHSGVEAAALELIGSDSFQALESDAPAGSDEPQDAPDDLTLIHGIGPAGQQALNGYGVRSFARLAALEAGELAWIDRALGLGGRAVRERWRAQAAVWAERKESGALVRAQRGDHAGRWTVAARAGAPVPADAAGPVAQTTAETAAETAKAALETVGGESVGAVAGAEARTATPDPTRRGRFSFLSRARARIPMAPKRPKNADETPPPDGRASVEGEAAQLIEARDPRIAKHRPALLMPEPSNGPRDDLKLIHSAGPKFMDVMNQLGLFYFAQLAQFDALDLAWLDVQLGARGRVARDRWGSQAAALQARKSSGALAIGPEGVWTEPGPGAEIDAAFEQARALPLTEAEAGAMRLLTEASGSGGYRAADSDAPGGLLAAASEGPADDLQRIRGVGPRCEAQLNRMGVFYFRQIAAFSAEELAWIDAKLRYNGRVVRDRWATIARLLGEDDEG